MWLVTPCVCRLAQCVLRLFALLGAWSALLVCYCNAIPSNFACVLQVFDCGCIGEGALHIVTAARKHLIPGAQILPASAQVRLSSK